MKILILISTVLVILMISCNNFISVNEIVKGDYKVPGKDFYFSIVELRFGALSQNTTTVRRVFNDKTYEIAFVTDKTGDVKKFEIKQDTVLFVLKYFEWHDSIYQETHKFSIFEKKDSMRYKLE